MQIVRVKCTVKGYESPGSPTLFPPSLFPPSFNHHTRHLVAMRVPVATISIPSKVAPQLLHAHFTARQQRQHFFMI
eukprot:1140283-Pelagomonas_calceolata.AAC.4